MGRTMNTISEWLDGIPSEQGFYLVREKNCYPELFYLAKTDLGNLVARKNGESFDPGMVFGCQSIWAPLEIRYD